MRYQDLGPAMAELHEKSQQIVNAADQAGRGLTASEMKQIEENVELFEKYRAQATLADQGAYLSAPTGRVTDATPGPTPGATTTTRRLSPAASATGNWGFDTFSSFLGAVRSQASGGGVDPRLIRAAATTYASEGAGADGGYALPPDFRTLIMSLVEGPQSLFAKLDQLTTPAAAVTMPTDEDPPWSATGIQAAQTAEGAAIAQTKPVLKQLTIQLLKYAVLVPVSDELLEDGTNMAAYVSRKSGDKLLWKINAAVFSAFANATAKVVVNKTGGAAAGSPPDLSNLGAMWARMPSSLRATAVWIANPALEPTFSTLAVGSFPVYLPAGGLAAAPNATLYGRPILYNELAAAVGAQGDITLVDPMSFYGVSKLSGVRSDVSPHLYFDQDLSAFRTVFRAGIGCKFSGVITRPDSTTAAPVVQLQVR